MVSLGTALAGYSVTSSGNNCPVKTLDYTPEIVYQTTTYAVNQLPEFDWYPPTQS